VKDKDISLTGRNLLSALRKCGSTPTLTSVPVEYFVAGDELNAYYWLKDFVRRFNRFPSPHTMVYKTGVRCKGTKESVEYYIEEARTRTFHNKLMTIHSEAAKAAVDRRPDDYIIAAKKAVALGRSSLFAGDTGVVTLDEALDEVVRDYDEAHTNFGLRGITSGWPQVDAMMDGHQRGDLNTLVGRPGRGKTNLLLYGAHAAWQQGANVLFVSMEMTSLQLGRRLLGIESKVNPRLMRTGTLDTRTRRELDDHILAMRDGLPFNIVVGNFQKSVDAVRSLADELLPDIIYADASYLLRPERKQKGSEGRRENVSDVVEELKQVAVERDVPVVQTVMFNRHAVKPKRADRDQDDRNPIAHLTMERIGETDVVSQVSSVIAGVERGDPPFQDIRRWFGFLKGREGEMGVWELNYTFAPVDFSIIETRDPLLGDQNPDDSPIPGIHGPMDLDTVVEE